MQATISKLSMFIYRDATYAENLSNDKKFCNLLT